MKKSAAANEHFIFRNTHPENLTERALAATAVNAAAVVTGKPWAEIFRSLIDQSHAQCRMPNDFLCVKEMLRSHHFILQPSHNSVSISAEDVRAYMDEHCTSGVCAIVRTVRYGYGAHLLAILPVTDENGTSYKIAGYEDRSRYRAEEIWLRWPDLEDHSPVARRKSGAPVTKKERRIPESHARYCYHQENPENRRIGDCLVRGLSSACGISWHEAVDLLTVHNRTTINTHVVFREVLKKQGFVHHDLYRPGEKYPTVAEFCSEANRKFRRGEHLFVYVGTSHVAAVLPFPEEDGSFRYRVVDTWDSSSGRATEYWVRPVPEEPAEETALPEFAVGDRIEHPVFGTGVVRTVSGDAPQIRLEIEFPEAGVKKFGAGWVAENCRKCG